MGQTPPRPTRKTAAPGTPFFLALTLGLLCVAPGPTEAQEIARKFESRLDEVVRLMEHDPRFMKLSAPERRDRIEFVAGNVLFALLHEVGHMLIGEMGLPVLGREEDAADAFATLVGLKVGTDLSERILKQSARGWFLSDRRNRKQNITTVFYEEHGLDQQRAYNIVCLMVGSNPDKFEDLSVKTALPPERQASCIGDFSNASWSWDKALAPHLRSAEQPKTTISIKYQDGGERYGRLAEASRQLGMLEAVAQYLSERYVWRRPVGLEMRVCGEPAARWERMEQKIIVCYELAEEFAMLYRDFANGQDPAKSASRRARYAR